MNASRRKQLIQTACDIEEVLKAYEHLAVQQPTAEKIESSALSQTAQQAVAQAQNIGR